MTTPEKIKQPSAVVKQAGDAGQPVSQGGARREEGLHRLGFAVTHILRPRWEKRDEARRAEVRRTDPGPEGSKAMDHLLSIDVQVACEVR
jgi:hypothetical protein